MRNDPDFSPLYRSSIGFDRVFNLLNNAQRLQAIDTWPPYDIVKTGEETYRIEMAVAGCPGRPRHHPGAQRAPREGPEG
jgi:molecular chaperone IbpA